MIIKLLFNTTETMLKDRGLQAEGKVQKLLTAKSYADVTFMYRLTQAILKRVALQALRLVKVKLFTMLSMLIQITI